jgi:hypothetical protein
MAGVAVAATSKCAPQPNPLVLGQSCRLELIPLASNDSRIAKADASVVTRAAFFRIFSTLAMGLQREKKNANSRNYVNQASPCYTDSADVRAHGLSPYNALGSTVTEIVLGDEYDDDLFARLAAEIAALGGVITDKEWTLGGSQEVTVFQITLPDGNIEAVAETYIGLSLRGPTELVEQLARRVMPNPLLQRTASPPAER